MTSIKSHHVIVIAIICHVRVLGKPSQVLLQVLQCLDRRQQTCEFHQNLNESTLNLLIAIVSNSIRTTDFIYMTLFRHGNCMMVVQNINLMLTSFIKRKGMRNFLERDLREKSDSNWQRLREQRKKP